jgi:hypothetical protein
MRIYVAEKCIRIEYSHKDIAEYIEQSNAGLLENDPNGSSVHNLPRIVDVKMFAEFLADYLADDNKTGTMLSEVESRFYHAAEKAAAEGAGVIIPMDNN